MQRICKVGLYVRVRRVTRSGINQAGLAGMPRPQQSAITVGQALLVRKRFCHKRAPYASFAPVGKLRGYARPCSREDTLAPEIATRTALLRSVVLVWL